MDVSKVVEYVKKSNELRLKAKELIKCADEALSEARELCPHAMTESKSDYYSGGYMDKAYTTINHYCSVCGKKVNTETIEHSWYG